MKGIDIYVENWDKDRRRGKNYKKPLPKKFDPGMTGDQAFQLFAAVLIGAMLLVGPFVR